MSAIVSDDVDEIVVSTAVKPKAALARVIVGPAAQQQQGQQTAPSPPASLVSPAIHETGHSWAVCFAAFFVNMVTGELFVGGLFFEAFDDGCNTAANTC